MSQFFEPNTVGPITYEDRQLWLSYRVPVAPGDRLHLLIERHRATPRQGVRLGCDNRRQKLRINAQESNAFTLWADTAPRHIEVQYLPPRSRGAVYLMNVWQLEGYEGVLFRGVNAASMAVSQPRDNEWLLECSDGYGLEPPTFDDLVLRVLREAGVSKKKDAA